MALWIIIAILLLGMLLIFLEIFFIPGTSLFGILGGVAVVAGVVLMYSYYGKTYGNITLGLSSVAVVIAIVMGFRVIESNKLAMKGEITGKVNLLDAGYAVGDKGTTVTELRPNGKAMINGNKVEIFSNGEYIPRNTEVEIIKITNDKIFIKPLNT